MMQCRSALPVNHRHAYTLLFHIHSTNPHSTAVHFEPVQLFSLHCPRHTAPKNEGYFLLQVLRRPPMRPRYRTSAVPQNDFQSSDRLLAHASALLTQHILRPTDDETHTPCLLQRWQQPNSPLLSPVDAPSHIDTQTRQPKERRQKKPLHLRYITFFHSPMYSSYPTILPEHL